MCRFEVRRLLYVITVVVAAVLPTGVAGQDMPPPPEPVVISGEQGVLQLVETRRITLDESKSYLADVNSADFFEDGSFVVASSKVARVVLYNADGTQRRVLGGWGPGPDEYERPTLVRAVGSTVYVRDNKQHKYMAIDSTGIVLSEWYGHTSGPDDFVVRGSWIISLNGQSFDYLIQGFDMSASDTLRAAPSSMEVSSNHVMAGAGNFGLDADRIHFAYPAENAFQTFDLSDGSLRSTPLPSPGYKRADYPFNGFEDTNRSLFDGRLMEYAARNSRAEGVHVLDDYIVALRADGEFPMETNVPTSRLRNRKLFVHDRDLKLVDTIVVDYEMLRVFGGIESAVYGNSIYYIVQSSEDGGRSVRWTLYQLEIQGR